MKKFLSAAICLCMCISMFGAFNVFADGVCGDGVSWSLSGGTLTISGSGAMNDFDIESEVPWYNSRSEIKKIVVEDGVTYIGNMAFYGCTNAVSAVIPNSVTDIGLSAFSYTEGSRTSISNVSAPYQFAVSSNKSQVKAGDEVVITITLKGDLKNLSILQSVLVYDKERLSADEENWYDEQWYESVNDDNLGYISAPAVGFVKNSFRLAYISLSGYKIDENSPLYDAGEVTVTAAKVKFKALTDISSIDMSCYHLENCELMFSDNGNTIPECSVVQLTSATVLPLSGITLYTENESVHAYANENGIKSAEISEENTEDPSSETADGSSEEASDKIRVYIDGKEIKFDVDPVVQNNRTLVPMRAIFSALGAVVQWEGETQTAFGIKKDVVIAIQLNNKYMFKNSEAIELDVPAFATNNRTLVPLRAISESFDCDVDWVQETNSVIITTK